MNKFIAALLIAGFSLPAFAMTADEIMQRVNDAATPDSMTSTMTMVLVDSKGNQRVRTLQTMRADFDTVEKSLMFFLEPSDVKGTGFLMFDYESAGQDDDQWMFLPALNKAKRIASGDKTGSFMGSDFSYADMSKRNIEEWSYKVLKEDQVNGADVWIVESLPVDDSVTEKTGYIRSIAYVRKDNFQVIRGINYLEKKGEVKLLNIPVLKNIDGYWVAMETQMISQKNGNTIHRTLMKISDIDINIDVDVDDFTLNRLEQGL